MAGAHLGTNDHVRRSGSQASHNKADNYSSTTIQVCQQIYEEASFGACNRRLQSGYKSQIQMAFAKSGDLDGEFVAGSYFLLMLLRGRSASKAAEVYI